MTDIFGRYESQTTKQLRQIDSSKYPDTNKDVEANLVRINQFIDYIAQYLQTMQKGVDQATMDPISRYRDTIFNIAALFGGGELLYGIDLGDLQYFLPALGAMFGFDSDQPFPINLLYAAENFFLGYVVPLDSWNIAVEDIIGGWMTALGLDQDFIDAVTLLLDNMGRFTGDLLAIFNDVTGLLGVFDIFDFVNGPIGPIWGAFSDLLSNFTIENLGAIADPFLETLTPWILMLAQLIGYVDDFIEMFSAGLGGGSGTLTNPLGFLTNFLGIFGLAPDSGIAGGNPIFDSIENIPLFGQFAGPFIEALTGSPLTGGGGVLGLFSVFTDFMSIFGNLSGLGTGSVDVDNILANIPLFGPFLSFVQPVIDALGPLLDPILAILSMFGAGSMPGGIDPIGMATTFITSFLNPLGLITSILDPNAPLDANNLFNLGNLLGILNIGSLTNEPQELLDNPDFREAISIQGGGIWTYDAAEGRTVLGSGRVTANGSLRQLMSNTIAVTESDELIPSLWTKWTGLTYTGTQPIKLQIVRLLYSSVTRSFATMGTDTIFATATPGANQATWTQLISGSNYVVPANTSHIALQVIVGTNATAGTIWVDDGSMKKVGGIQTGWIPGLDTNLGMLSQIFDIVQNISIVPINDAVSAFQSFFNSLGIRFGENESNHQGLLDQLFGGFKQITSSGIGSGDVGTAAGETSVLADTSMQLGEWNNAIISLRNNKDLFEGVDETEEANFKLDKVWDNAGTEPAATILATSAAIPVAYKNFAEDAKKGFISWFGKGVVTELRIDVYRANLATNTWDGPIYTSPNVQALVGAGWQYITHNISALIDRIDVSSGIKLGIAWRVVGAGTHSIAGMPYNQPAAPTIHPKRPVSVRTGSGALSFASTDYSPLAVPWFGIGIITGDVPPPYYSPRSQTFTTPGNGTYTIPAEFRVAGNIIDRVACGSGSGGTDSFFYIPGSGGNPGSWAHGSLVYGTDIPLGAATLAYHVANGGAGGGGAGEASTVTGTGVSTLSAVGGTGTGSGGDGPGDHDWAGKHYTGGSGNGSSPGSGGRGAGPYGSGGNGGNGMVSFTARQP